MNQEKSGTLAHQGANWVQAAIVPLLYAVFAVFALLLVTAWLGHVFYATSITSGVQPRGLADAAAAVVYLTGGLSCILTLAMVVLTSTRSKPSPASEVSAVQADVASIPA